MALREAEKAKGRFSFIPPVAPALRHITKRCTQQRPLFRRFPVKNAIIDCELLACGEDGLPSFRALMELGNKATLVLVAFDLLHLDGVRLTPIAIEERKAILQTLTARMATPYVQFSEGFDDPAALMKACAKMEWEGIVSKRKGSAYRAGPTKDWLKIKTSAWRKNNTRRWEMFKA